MEGADRRYFRGRTLQEIRSAQDAACIEAGIAHAKLAGMLRLRCAGCTRHKTSECVECALAYIVQGEAATHILETYQPEREPNVRAIIGLAMMMGRTVCINDPDAAATRDAQMLAARAAKQEFGSSGRPR